jgi:hypothetical protein
MTLTRGTSILAISIAVLFGINHVLRVAGLGAERGDGYIHYFLVGRAEHPPLVVYAIYAVFSAFLFCQTAHVKHYEGASKTFDAILTILGFTCFVTGIGYAVAVAFRYTWLDLIPFFLLHNAVRLILIPIDQKRSGPMDAPKAWDWIIFGGSMAGLLVVPASLVALFVITF